MRPSILRLLFAAIVVVALLGATASPAQDESGTEQPTAAPSPTPQPTPEPLRNGCEQLYTRKEHGTYTKAVYHRKKISRRAKQRIKLMRLCQHSDKKQKAARKLELRQKRARYRRAHTLCGTPYCNRNLGRIMAARRGWIGSQFSCLDSLWGARESGWNRFADNPTSSAYGIPQALPGSKMGAGWQWNARVQIRWGLGYIAGRYGTPCGALSHSHANNWY